MNQSVKMDGFWILKCLKKRFDILIMKLAILGNICLAIFGNIWQYIEMFGNIWQYLYITGWLLYLCTVGTWVIMLVCRGL